MDLFHLATAPPSPSGLLRRPLHPLQALARWTPRHPLVWAALGVLSVFLYGLMHYWPWLRGNDQWCWGYRQTSWALVDGLRGLVWIVPAGMVGWWAWRRVSIRPAGRARTAGRLAILVAWGVYTHWVVFHVCFALGWTHLGRTIIMVTSTGHFEVAMRIVGGQLPPLSHLLPHFPDYMNLQHFPLHSTTHPPGPILLCTGLIRLFEASPLLTRAVHALMSGLGVQWAMIPAMPVAWQVAAQTLGGLLMLCGALTVVPLYDVVRRTVPGPPAAAEALAAAVALLWLHHPPLLIFSPEFDQLYVLMTVGALALALRGMERRTAGYGFALGLTIAFGFLMTFKLVQVWLMGPVLIVLAWVKAAGIWHPALLWQWTRTHRPQVERLAGLLGYAGIGFGLLMGTAYWGAGIDLPAIFAHVLGLQEYYHTHMGRTWGTWIVWGPLDFLIIGGPAIAFLALWHLLRVTPRNLLRPATIQPGWLVFPLAVILMALGGVVRAENSRIWMIFAPGLAWAAVAALTRREAAPRPADVLALAAAQFAWLMLVLSRMTFLDR